MLSSPIFSSQGGVDAELLSELATQGARRRLAALYFPARELPLAGMTLGGGALADEHSAAA